jgi:hypothetical protein
VVSTSSTDTTPAPQQTVPPAAPAESAPGLAIDLSPTAPAAQQTPPAHAAAPIVPGLLAGRDRGFDVLAHTSPLRYLHRHANAAADATANDLDPRLSANCGTHLQSALRCAQGPEQSRGAIRISQSAMD